MYTIKDYLKALSPSSLDSSEFSLIGISYLEKVLNENPNAELRQEINQLKTDFSSDNYMPVANQIISLCKKYPNIVNNVITQALMDRVSSLTNDPDKNHNRRFFETNLSTHLDERSQDPSIYKSIEPLAQVMRSMGLKSITGNVNSPRDAQLSLLSVCRFNDNIEMDSKEKSKIYGFKDRTDKGATGIHSRNIGIMKSTTPNFYDQLSDKDLKDRVVDKFKVDRSKDSGFSGINEEIPFVNSVSGTTFTLSVLLNEMITRNKNSPTLEVDVNNIIQSFMAVYVKNGYHSLGEMQKVLNEEHIKKIFTENAIVLDLRFPDEVMTNTFKDAQSYSMTTCIKKAMMEELKKTIPEIKPIEPKVSSLSPSVTIAQQLGLNKGTLKTFTDRPGRNYFVFQTDKDKLEAYQKIIDTYGSQAVRIAGIKNTIEILDVSIVNNLNKPIKVEIIPTDAPEQQIDPRTRSLPVAPEQQIDPRTRSLPVTPSFSTKQSKMDSLTEAGNALSKGVLTEFVGRPGKTYFVFENDTDKTKAVKAIADEFGTTAVRVAGNPNTIEILKPEILSRIKQSTPQNVGNENKSDKIFKL